MIPVINRRYPRERCGRRQLADAVHPRLCQSEPKGGLYAIGHKDSRDVGDQNCRSNPLRMPGLRLKLLTLCQRCSQPYGLNSRPRHENPNRPLTQSVICRRYAHHFRTRSFWWCKGGVSWMRSRASSMRQIGSDPAAIYLSRFACSHRHLVQSSAAVLRYVWTLALWSGSRRKARLLLLKGF